MKILITADWHLGKRLHMEDFSIDMEKFFQWLLVYIKENEVDYLLLAGDVFDQNNPSNEASKQYYDFLVKLSRVGCKAIITSGNHDSPSFLDTPSTLLQSLGITVVGKFPGHDQIEKILLPIEDKSGKNKAVVAAIPFLQDRFIRQVGENEGIKTIDAKIKEGMRKIFMEIGNETKRLYPTIPHIGMAHLHAQGTTISEAEREIQIGNELGIPADALDQFDYLGLGHIHTGQPVIDGRIHYASSPISLGFSENTYNHKVIQLEITEGNINQTFVPIPKFRSLYQLKGSLQEVEEQLSKTTCKYDLTTLLDIYVDEPTYDATVMQKIETWKQEIGVKNLRIVNLKVNFRDKSGSRRISSAQQNRVNELEPKAVFEKLLEERKDENEKAALMEIFNNILADATQQP